VIGGSGRSGEWRNVELDIVRITGLWIFLNNIFEDREFDRVTRDDVQKLTNKIARNQFSYKCYDVQFVIKM
jgi:hypothetical protein